MEKKILALGMLLLVIFVFGCTQHNTTGAMIMIDKETTIPEDACLASGLQNKVVFIGSAYCGHCAQAEPKLEKIESELGKDFIFLDLSEEEDLAIAESLNLKVVYTPTVLVGCDVLLGDKSEEFYREKITSLYTEK